MKIKKINENPFRKHEVKKLPKDSKYIENAWSDGSPIYYSESKNAYYIVIK